MKIINIIRKKFLKSIDGVKLSYSLKICFIIIFFCFAFNFIGIGLSKYESNAISKAKPSIAFFLIEEGTYEKKLPLGRIVPSTNKYVYQFTVSNYNDIKTTDVSMEYTITFITTTNLPLTYEVYKNENYTNDGALNIVSNQEIYQDKNKVYYNKIIIDDIGFFTHKEKQTDVYNLVIDFDEKYQNTSDDYSGYVELVKVIIDAKQKISDGE